MPFRIPVTPAIQIAIENRLGTKIDPAGYAVYEARVNTTKPIPFAGGYFKDGYMTTSYLQDMVNQLESYTGSVSLIDRHQTYEMPLGQVFYAAVDTNSDLRALFFVPRSDTVNSVDHNLNLGVYNAVSSNSRASSLTCSACGYDYLASNDGANKLRENYWYDTPVSCPNDHIVGENNVVLVSQRCELWRELSLVEKGGEPMARVIDSAEAYLPQLLESRNVSSQVLSKKDDKSKEFLTLSLDHKIPLQKDNKPVTLDKTSPNPSEYDMPLSKEDLEQIGAFVTETLAKAEEAKAQKLAAEEQAAKAQKQEADAKELAEVKEKLKEAEQQLAAVVEKGLEGLQGEALQLRLKAIEKKGAELQANQLQGKVPDGGASGGTKQTDDATGFGLKPLSAAYFPTNSGGNA